MAKDIVSCTATDGKKIEFVNEVIGSGAMKNVYFTPDKTRVAAFFRKPLDANAKDRLENITGIYREKIFDSPNGDYWKKLFCWPTAILNWEGKIGLLSPAYDSDFFFKDGPFAGREKEGKWFTTAKLRNKFLRPEDKGAWINQISVCLNIARAVRRLHAAGLAHSDLSYKNVLVDPSGGRACIIDIDGLVVPGKYPPDVVGTPDFIAPEVMATRNLKIGDPKKNLPKIETDKHALAVLIYMNLLFRHPLRGSKVHDLDSSKDEELSMGANALFIEHPVDHSNRPKISQLDQSELPQRNIDKLPYDICGPYLKKLFDRAFIDGLHKPELRPTAADWETALLKTLDLIQPCSNKTCEAKWFAFDNTTKPTCPYCGTVYSGALPILNLYYSHKPGNFRDEHHRLMVYHQQSLYPWHCNRNITCNEKLDPANKKPVGDFHFHQGNWILINRRLPDLWDKTENKKIDINQAVILSEGKRILFSNEPGARLAVVQLVKN